MAQTVTKSQANGELKELKADIAALRSDFSKLFDDTGALAKTKTDEAVAQGRELANSTSDRVMAQKTKVEDHIRENPLPAIGIAFGVGVLLAAVGRR